MGEGMNLGSIYTPLRQQFDTTIKQILIHKVIPSGKEWLRHVFID